jgi:hypothetical protein
VSPDSPQIKTEDLEDSYIPGSDRPTKPIPRRNPTPGPSNPPPPSRPLNLSEPKSHFRKPNPLDLSDVIPSYDHTDFREKTQRDQPFDPQVTPEQFEQIIQNPLRRSFRVPKPTSKDQNLYGPKTPAQIEAEIQKGKDTVSKMMKDWTKTQKIQPDPKPAPPAGSEQELLKEGGISALMILMSKAIADIDPCLAILALSASSLAPPVPVQYRDVAKMEDKELQKGWHSAMQEEIKALNDRDVWELLPCPADRVPVRCRWVYSVKSDGRKRARLVAKGFSQLPGIDYDETFSPITRFESVRIILALSALNNWDIEALDVKTAFLYGELDEEIYMEQPEGFVQQGSTGMVYRLKKALYGLKQASLAWYRQAHKSLEKLGFKRCFSDSGIYLRQDKVHITLCVLYVDNLLFLGDCHDLVLDHFHKDKFTNR